MARTRPKDPGLRNIIDFTDESFDERGQRLCEWPGCETLAEFRAPRSRTRLRDFRWFCLDHVREYNAAWNYFAGLDEGEIEHIRQRDTVWHRPSWPLGSAANGDDGRDGTTWRGRESFFRESRDDFGLFGESPEAAAPDPERDQALAALDLDRAATDNDIKARYKALVKKYHPDANGGCKASEERFKAINNAYTYLTKADQA